MKHPFGLSPIALALACIGAVPALAQQLPTWNNHTVMGGSVTVGTPTAGGTQLGITQQSTRAIIDWQGFSIGQGHGVNIAQPSAASVLLNRVTGGDPSTIAGSLTANGRVFLVNPNGVLFTNTSSVNVGGLVASTLSLGTSDDAFMQGTERFEFQRGAESFGELRNEGSLTAANGGTVALIGAMVSNEDTGSIVAQGGTAGLVSAEAVTVDFMGDGLTSFKLSPGMYSAVMNRGLVQADGGRVLLLATAGEEVAQGVVNSRGVLRANTLGSRGGEIVLDSGSSIAGVTIDGGLLSATGQGAGQKGGSVEVTGRTVLLRPTLTAFAGAEFPVGSDDRGVIDVSGVAGGGRVLLQARAVSGEPQSGAIAFDADSIINADATGSGDGGDIRLMGERTLRAYGTLSARGGPAGGNGGFMETSGGFAAPMDEIPGGIDLAGLRVDASAPAGTAGTWMIDPFDVTIVNGSGPGSLPPFDPFEPIQDSIIQDGDINAALNAGTSVRITTGNPAAGDPTIGDIFMDDAIIDYEGAHGPLTFQLDAHRSVRANSGTSIGASGNGSLNVVFNADANGAGAAVGGGQVSYSGTIYTNGGSVDMTGTWSNPSNSMCSICLTFATIDTRAGNVSIGDGLYTGGSDAGPGGAVRLTGISSGPGSGADSRGAVFLQETLVTTATGDVTLFGRHSASSGVEIEQFEGGGIFTTSGNVRLTGIGSYTPNSADMPGHGVSINAGVISTGDGNIAVHGRRFAGGGEGGDADGAGVLLQNQTLLQTTGAGDIEITGQADGSGAGVTTESLSIFGGPRAEPGIISGRNVTIRAVNDGSTDAIVLMGPVTARNALNLRPGGIDDAGNAHDRPAVPITVGGGANPGFAVSSVELSRLNTPTLVIGSGAHAADINVVSPLSMSSALTLHNGAGGNIRLGGPVSTPHLALLSAGQITQAAGAAIVADRLLARSSGGDVLLNDPGNNVAVGTVGGGAAGRFEYTDTDDVTLGAVSAITFDAASNLPQTVPGGPVTANRILVRTLSGDLSLGTDVSSTGGTDLVAAGRFQNLGAFSITGAPWRVWADTWVGETRGGLFGSGLLPNLYNCAYLGLCGVTVSATDNHFIYAQQPSATVVIHDASRRGGLPNPPFFFSITGLILGDTGAGFIGTMNSPATIASLPGVYPIDGSFLSAAGYAVDVVPGRLTVGDFVQLPKPDVLRELPSSWLYDRNIGPAPICLAAAPLDGSRAEQGGDVLAREWSRVRSRPNLTNCIDSQRRSGCGDF